MIPKIIHYVWLGDKELPDLLTRRPKQRKKEAGK